MTDFNQEFPFEEIRKDNGDYFLNVAEAKAAGYAENQIWSVMEADGCWTYGPSHHWINVVGFIATTETHDGNTYYNEPEEDFDGEEDEADE